MSTTGPPAREPSDGVDIALNRVFLKEQIPEYAYKQVKDAKHGRTNTRKYASKTNNSLPDRSWQVLDDTVYRTQEETLTLVNDLLNAGLRTERDILTKNDTWPLVDDRGDASTSTTPDVDTEEGSVTWDDDGVPIPIVHDFFTLGFREAQSPESDRSVGESVDTIGLSTTTRRVDEEIERLFISGWDQSITFDGEGYTLYGLTNHPQTNTATFDADWTVDNSIIRDDVRRMRGIIKNDNNFSPGPGYWLYLGTEFYDELDDADPEGSGDITIRERVANLSNISQVKELDFLGAKEALMFRPTEDVVDVGVASEVQAVQWEDPFRDYWVVLGSVYPRVKRTLSDQSGIVHFTL